MARARSTQALRGTYSPMTAGRETARLALMDQGGHEPERVLSLEIEDRERLCTWIERAEVRANQALRANELFSNFEEFVRDHMKREFGHGLFARGHGVGQCVRWETGQRLQRTVAATSACLHQIEQLTGENLDVDAFEMRVNEVIASSDCDWRLVRGQWHHTEQSEADELLRELLSGAAHARCHQDDPQIEAAWEAVKDGLLDSALTIVDYGAGLARMAKALTASGPLISARFVAVDDAGVDGLDQALRPLANAVVMGRAEYLREPTPADVVLMVNVLHHIAFKDLALELSSILASLKPGGMLVVHEIGELGRPEKRNVPWSEEDITTLFDMPILQFGARATTLPSGKLLPHVHVGVRKGVELSEAANLLEHRIRVVWHLMKDRVLESIRILYQKGSGDNAVALRRALIINANLDLNQPE